MTASPVERIGPQLEQWADELVLAGEVELAAAARRLEASWRKARVKDAVRKHAVRAHEQERALANARAATPALVIELPIRTFSEANITHQHWGQKQKLVGDQRPVVKMAVIANARAKGVRLELPASVRLVRVGSELDVGDNLEMSLKHVRDGVADAFGVGDRGDHLLWDYGQEPGRWGVRIEIAC